MALINPYLNFQGNTEDAFKFYKSVFGGEFAMIIRFKDMPENDRIPEEDKDKIMHIALPIGGNVLMGTDALESVGHKLTVGNNYSISVSAQSFEEGQNMFSALSDGGKVEVPYSKQSWGDTFGMLTDKFGAQWMVSFSEQYQQ
jgi:PhnB protein